MPTALAAAADDDDAPPPIGWQEMHAQRGFMLSYARRRLQDPALAEDVVHDVFEAVLGGRACFGGRSAARGWLVGILRHKIVDLIRSRGAIESLEAMADDEAGVAMACPCSRPDELAEQRERLAQTLARVDRLPPGLRRAVELRILLERDSDEVCRDLDISPANLHVRLHRARLLLLAEAAA